MKIRKLIIIASILMVAALLTGRLQREPIENLIIEPGIGIDIKKSSDDKLDYVVTVPAYTFSENKVSSRVYVSSASSITETREARQRKLDKRFIAGFEKVYVFGEEYARYGIRNILDILLKNQFVNDEGFTAVCKGKAEDMMKLKVDGYPSSADFIDGLIYSSRTYNFFPAKYALINMYKFMEAEGTTAVMPYIEVRNKNIEITGVAVFKKDKMVAKLDSDDAKIMNMLKENGVRGIFDIKRDPKGYISYETAVKRKVKCYKDQEKYKFIIDLSFTGDIVSNELYSDSLENPGLNKKIEEDMSKKIEKVGTQFIERMQSNYKIDMLNLGSVAAAKYGRHTGTDWDEEISKADIQINVKVKIDKFGRGDY